MQKSFKKILLTFIIVFIVSFSGKQLLAKQSDFSEALKDILTSEEQKTSLFETILTLSCKADKAIFETNCSDKFYNDYIKEMAQSAKAKATGNNPEDWIKAINEVIFQENNFKSDLSNLFNLTENTLFVNRVLDDKRGSCLTLSIIYLAIAEELNLPFYAVHVPGHLFVRYDNGKKQINVETTQKGQIKDNKYYIQTHIKKRKQELFLNSLSKREMTAIYLSNLGNQYKLSGFHESAIQCFKKALEIKSQSPDILTNLGNVYERKGEIFKAIAQYETAIGLDPYTCEAHYNLGLAHYLYTKRLSDARKHGIIAAQLGCRLHPQFRKFLLESQ